MVVTVSQRCLVNHLSCIICGLVYGTGTNGYTDDQTLFLIESRAEAAHLKSLKVLGLLLYPNGSGVSPDPIR